MILRVILQIVPRGDETKMREIGRLDIFNKGEFAGDFHSYGVIDFTPEQEGMFDGELHHQRKNGPWVLVAKAIRELDIQ